jgi:hypothetical protein
MDYFASDIAFEFIEHQQFLCPQQPPRWQNTPPSYYVG